MFAATLLCIPALLQACGPERRASTPLESPAPVSAAGRPTADLEPAWATTTQSPAPVAASADPVHAAFQAPCGANDRALEGAASAFAHALGQGEPTPEADEIALWLRRLGSPYVWPRAWALEGPENEIMGGSPRLASWLETFGDGGERRCGVGSATANGRRVVAVVAVDVLADLEPLPVRAHVGAWLSLGATLLVPASAAKVVLLGPSGAPRTVPTSLQGQRVSARFALERPGRFVIQVLADVRGGPRPVVEALVFAGADPSSALGPEAAPGEEAAAGASNAAQAIERMLGVARRKEALPGLSRLEALDRIAQAHADAMRDSGRIGHDVGDGNPAARVAAAGILALSAGENVAHAMSIIQAHRSLYASPSHRSNMLSPAFDSIGIGVAGDRDGTFWVCQLYARVAP